MEWAWVQPNRARIRLLSAARKGRSTARTRLRSCSRVKRAPRDAPQLPDHAGDGMRPRGSEIDRHGLAVRHVAVQGRGDEAGRGVLDVDVVPLRPEVAEADRRVARFQLRHDLRQQVGVRLARADDVEQPHHDGRKPHRARGVADIMLAVELAQSVDVARLDEGRVLHMRLRIGLVDRSAAREDEAATGRAGGEEILRPRDVGLDREGRVDLAFGDVVDRREMDHRVGREVGDHAADLRRIVEIGLHEFDALEVLGREPDRAVADRVRPPGPCDAASAAG